MKPGWHATKGVECSTYCWLAWCSALRGKRKETWNNWHSHVAKTPKTLLRCYFVIQVHLVHTVGWDIRNCRHEGNDIQRGRISELFFKLLGDIARHNSMRYLFYYTEKQYLQSFFLNRRFVRQYHSCNHHWVVYSMKLPKGDKCCRHVFVGYYLEIVGYCLMHACSLYIMFCRIRYESLSTIRYR